MNVQLQFIARMGDAINTEIQNIQYEITKRNYYKNILLQIEVTYATYEVILTQSLFNLHLPVIKKGSQYIKSDELVELTIEMTEDVLYSFPKVKSKEEILTFFKEQETRYLTISPYLKTESWKVLMVKQKQVLPDDMKEIGTLKMGYETLWAENPFSKLDSLKEQVIFVLKELKWAFEEVEEYVFLVNYSSDKGKWSCIIELVPEKKRCIFYSVFPTKIEESYYNSVFKFINATNCKLEIGNFELDVNTSILRFRTSIGLGSQALETSIFQDLAFMNVKTMNYFLPNIEKLIQNEKPNAN